MNRKEDVAEGPYCLEKAGRSPLGGGPGAAPALSGLPADILQESSRRLGGVCLIYAFSFTLAYFVSGITEWIDVGTLPEHLRSFKSYVAIAAIGLAMLLCVLTRVRSIKPTVLLNLGLIFEVIGAFGIAMTSLYGAFPVWSEELLESVGYVGIPWECVLILLFPLVALNTPRRVLVASLAAASMGPLAVAISKVTGATSPDASPMFFAKYFLFTTYLCAFIAFLVSRIIFRAGMRLKKAREIGQYQMEELLGRGGMGEVWRARHRLLARPAAIKLIRADVLGGNEAQRLTLIRRFEREAQATARLRSTHTISVYDFGVTEQGVFYYVMELLDGIDLDSFVKRFGPLRPARTISLLRQVCHSLMEAHERGMVHRDIKPANLYLCRLGPDHDFVKVLDFGLVKSPRKTVANATQLTQEGISFGTPGFMAPEMATGSAETDGRSDLYALGCVAYWLLTGGPVFEGDTPLATVLHHIQTEPVPPSHRSEIEIPSDLEEIVLACLAKEPARRPQTARELDQRLARCQTENPWTPEQAAEWWALHLPTAGD